MTTSDEGDGTDAASDSPLSSDLETRQKLVELVDRGHLTESEAERLCAGLERVEGAESDGNTSDADDDTGGSDTSDDDDTTNGTPPSERVETLESEVERLRRAVAERERQLQAKREEVDDYIETQEERLAERRRRLTADLVEGLLAEVYAPLGRALGDETTDAEALREGVEMTRSGFEAVLADQDVAILDPGPETELDRERHAVERTVAADAPSGTIVEVHAPGFAVEGDVVSKARVYVAE